jgi:hypothetical protein
MPAAQQLVKRRLHIRNRLEEIQVSDIHEAFGAVFLLL